MKKHSTNYWYNDLLVWPRNLAGFSIEKREYWTGRPISFGKLTRETRLCRLSLHPSRHQPTSPFFFGQWRKEPLNERLRVRNRSNTIISPKWRLHRWTPKSFGPSWGLLLWEVFEEVSSCHSNSSIHTFSIEQPIGRMPKDPSITQELEITMPKKETQSGGKEGKMADLKEDPLIYC